MFYSFCLDTQLNSEKLDHTHAGFLSALSNIVATSHVWLLNIKLIKIKWILKMELFSITTLEVLNSHI